MSKVKQIKPPLTKNQILLKKYLELAKRFNADGSWFNTRNKNNTAEHLISKVREFINKNDRLRSKYEKMLEKSTKGLVREFKIEMEKAREENRRKREGVRAESEKS